jgi:transposase
MMLHIKKDLIQLVGTEGRLTVNPDDEITLKLAMLYEGVCEGMGATRAARKLGYSRQRYFQLLHAFEQGGALALRHKKTGPRNTYRRTDEVIRLVIRHRFLDPDASPSVIAQRLRQCGWQISARSVSRIISDFGLQKKTSRFSSP